MIKNDWTLRKLIKFDLIELKAFLIEFYTLVLGSVIVWLYCMIASLRFAMNDLSYTAQTWSECEATQGGCGIAIIFILAFEGIVFAAIWLVVEGALFSIWFLGRLIKIPFIILSFLTLVIFVIISLNYEITIFSVISLNHKSTDLDSHIMVFIIGLFIASIQILFGYAAKWLSQKYLIKSSPQTQGVVSN